MMDELAQLTERLLEGPVRSNLILSALPSVGVRWLNRQLPLFLGEHPDLRVDLRLEEDPIDFFRNRIDVRLSYGHLYPEFNTVPFRRDSVTALCRPELISDGVDVARPGLLRDEDLIHVTWRVGFSSYPDWGAWLAAQGVTHTPRHELGHTADTSSLAIDLACTGCGIVLASRFSPRRNWHPASWWRRLRIARRCRTTIVRSMHAHKSVTPPCAPSLSGWWSAGSHYRVLEQDNA